MTSIFTYQTRLSVLPVEADAALSACAEVMSRIERKLFARIVVTGKSAGEFKNEFVEKHHLTARQFNAIRVGLEGKMASIQERRPGLIEELEHQIARARKVIGKLRKRLAAARKQAHEVRSGRTVWLTRRRVRRALTLEEAREVVDKLRATLHQKQRRLGVLEKRKERLEQDQRRGAMRLCFGSRKLFRAQFALEENGYRSQEEWKGDWKASRSCAMPPSWIDHINRRPCANPALRQRTNLLPQTSTPYSPCGRCVSPL
jgi:hypothetical protein